MTLRIRATPEIAREDLRTLLIDAASELAGTGSRLLEPRLPWEGTPILLVDGNAQPVLVSFDLDDSQAALVNGLRAADRLVAALPWVTKVYDALNQAATAVHLVVVSGEPAPGHRTLPSGTGTLTLLTCKVLSINEDTGLLLEPVSPLPDTGSGSPETASPAVEIRPRLTIAGVTPDTTPTDEPLPPLSAAETAYFQQL